MNKTEEAIECVLLFVGHDAAVGEALAHLISEARGMERVREWAHDTFLNPDGTPVVGMSVAGIRNAAKAEVMALSFAPDAEVE